MQAILGAGGAIGAELAKELTKFTDEIKIVSRNPKKINDGDILFPADLTVREEVFKAIEGSEVAYLTIGLPYKTKVWQAEWPNLMRNVLDACKEHGTRLVFFDNLYMYDPKDMAHATENSIVNPTSSKGKVRAHIAKMLMDEVEQHNLKALIARAADFYGPGINNSVLIETVYKPLKDGKKANWFCNLNKVHSFTYTPDAAKATAILGNDLHAYGQVWHLPTASNPLTGRQWVQAFAEELKVKPRVQVAGKFIIQIMGLFNPLMKEFVEMLYQYDRDYVFDSSKFEKAYDFKPTSYQKGIQEVVNLG